MKYSSINEVISEKISGEWGTEPTSDNFVGIIRTTNFTNDGEINFSNVVKRNVADSKVNKKKLKVGDVIIEKSGGSPTQPVGRVVFFDLDDGNTYLCNNFTSILRASEKIYPKFLFYNLLFSHLNHKTLSYQNKTTGIINLQLDRYLKFEQIPLPPLEEQKHIVDVLDQANFLRKKRKEAIKLLDEYLKSVFLDMFGNPVSNPLDWKKLKLGLLGSLDRGKSKHRPRNAPELLGGVHPLIQTGDVARSGLFINTYNSTYSDIGLKQSKKWPKGTLCITIAANIAKTGIINFDACFPDSVVGFVADNSKTNSIFIHYWMSFFQKILEASAPESAQKNINLRILKALEVINPPIELQNKFITIVEETEGLKKVMTSQLEQIETHLSAVTHQTFGAES